MGQLASFLEALQVGTDAVLRDLDAVTDQIDTDRAREEFANLLLLGLGDPFGFDLAPARKRALVRALPRMWLRTGTRAGLVDALRFFLNLEFTVDDGVGQRWILGEGALNDTAVLAPDPQVGSHGYRVVSPVALTPEQRDQVTAIAQFQEPATAILLGLTEP